MTATTTRTRATAAKTAATKAEQTVRKAKAPGTKTKTVQVAKTAAIKTKTAQAAAAKKLAAKKLAAEKLAAEKLAAEKLAAEKLAAEKLAAEKLAAKKLAAKKLAAKKQATFKAEQAAIIAKTLADIKAEQTTTADEAPGTKTKTAQAAETLTARQAVADKLSGMRMPTGTKVVLSFVANLITIGASYYVGATVTVALATMVAGLTSSFFLVWMTLFIGQVLSLIGALIMGAKVQFWILNDSYKAVLAAPSKVSNKVSGWFTKSAA